MEEEAARRHAWFDAPLALEREIFEPRHRPVDPRQRPRERRRQVGRAKVELVVTRPEEEIAPACRPQPLADSGHAIDERDGWRQRASRRCPDDGSARGPDRRLSPRQHRQRRHDGGAGRKLTGASEQATACPRRRSRQFHDSSPRVRNLAGHDENARWPHGVGQDLPDGAVRLGSAVCRRSGLSVARSASRTAVGGDAAPAPRGPTGLAHNRTTRHPRPVRRRPRPTRWSRCPPPRPRRSRP